MEGATATRLVCPACNARYDGGGFCAKDGTPLVPDTNQARDNLVGQVLADRYRIVRLLGEGGMGQVYEAQHVNINKRFAIKLLRPEIVSNNEAVQRFRQEAWSASSIGHDNIVAIDDFAKLPDGSVYLAMEFLQGMSLSERMKKGPIELAEALDIFAQVARGLAAAHEKNIIHRDMKPENVFLAQKSQHTVVKVLDFGIAKVSGAEGASSLTRTGAIFGTPHYMSPEQALGKPLDYRTDIYSVGVIMYEVFTGRVPFEAESFMGILTKHITSEPKRPTEAAPERNIPPEIEALILRAMAKDAAQRPASMNDLMAEIITLMQGFAPQFLTPSGSQVLAAARPSSPMLAAHTSGPLRVSQPTPSGLRRLGGASQPMNVATSQPGLAPQPAGHPPTDGVQPLPYEAAPKKSSAGLIFGIVGALLVGAGAAAFVIFKKPPEPPPAAPVVVTPPPQVQKAPDPVPPPATPPAPAMESVIVDSLPPGAKIMQDGKQIGETPEEVKVSKGTTVSVALKKDGFVEEPVVVDPTKGHKMLVKLVRTGGGKKPGKAAQVYTQPPVKLPAPPPIPTVAPTSTVATPPPVKPAKPHRPVDPYERLDDAPAKKADVLNPY